MFSGDGSSLFKSGTVTLSGSLQVHNLQLIGATLDGTNQLGGDLQWISGNWARTAAVTLNTQRHARLRPRRRDRRRKP